MAKRKTGWIPRCDQFVDKVVMINLIYFVNYPEKIDILVIHG